jgi:uncharacterized phage protein (TIGR01671 family)
MREIKFRAWHKEFKTMYWFDVINGMKHGIGSGYIPMAPWGFPITISQYKDNLVPVDPMECELMQYTGLKDKNGKEIYEGDIIRSFFSDGQECIHKIGYESAEGRFTASWKLISCGINQAWINEFEKEVIGNIYENPELVKF